MATELKRSASTIDRIEELLGAEAQTLLEHKSQAIPSSQLYLPGPDFIDRVCAQSDRSPAACVQRQTFARRRGPADPPSAAAAG